MIGRKMIVEGKWIGIVRGRSLRYVTLTPTTYSVDESAKSTPRQQQFTVWSWLLLSVLTELETSSHRQAF